MLVSVMIVVFMALPDVIFAQHHGGGRGHLRHVHGFYHPGGSREHLRISHGFYHPVRNVYVGVGFRYSRYGYYDPFWDPWYYDSYPYRTIIFHQENMVLVDADSILVQIEKLKAMKDEGMLTEKEFKKAKKRLLDKIGQFVPAEEKPEKTDADLSQIKKPSELKELNVPEEINLEIYTVDAFAITVEKLKVMEKAGILTDNEFARKKSELLKRIGKPAASSQEGMEILAFIERLFELKENKVLNDLEFQMKKEELLKRL